MGIQDKIAKCTHTAIIKSTVPASRTVIPEHQTQPIAHMEKLKCMIVYCAVLSVCTSASPKFSTPMISALSLQSLMAMLLVQGT